MPGSPIVYVGTVAFCNSVSDLVFYEKGAIAVDCSGSIVAVLDLTRMDEGESAHYMSRTMSDLGLPVFAVEDMGSNMIIPGFVDGHAHAPQHEFTGTGMDMQLLDWLMTYTFPTESKYKDAAYAKTMYTDAVSAHLRNGTTTCSYFATIHPESCKVLVDVVRTLGQRAFVGKVNMDRNSPDFYIEESASKSLSDTEDFINYTLGLKDSTVTPVITPRFVPSCTKDLLHGLGELANTYSLPVQSHCSENEGEMKWVAELHPECPTYMDVYKDAGLLPEGRAYMAHCCLCGTAEREILASTKTGVIHCPTSNFDLYSGTLNVRRMLTEGIKVGLGTDVSGGYSPSILVALRHALIAAQATHINDRSFSPLSWKEAFFLATLGGAQAIGLGDLIGNFAVGKKFDALIIDVTHKGSPFKVYGHDKRIDHLQKFLYLGDDRNIARVIVDGKVVITNTL
jgi:guanine deaminase